MPISITSQIDLRFADYNHMKEAEALQQSSSIQSEGHQKLSSKSTVFHAVVTFYLLQYEMSEDDLAHIISNKAIHMLSQIL